MNGIKSVLSQKKWADLFFYQFTFPILIILIAAICLGVIFQSFISVFLQFAYDGELYLISIFLIVGTFIELDKGKKKGGKPIFFSSYWMGFVMLGMLFYGFNKVSVYLCGSCISEMKMEMREWFFISANGISIIAAPYYCVTSIVSTILSPHN